MRKKILAGNWKMNKSMSDVSGYFDLFAEGLGDLFQDQAEIWFALPSLLLQEGVRVASNRFRIGSQNVHFASNGAFTGENSVEMVQECGASFTLIGHSERRTLFHEDDLFIANKVKSCQQKGFAVMLCVGESLSEREQGLTEVVLAKQLGTVFAITKKWEGISIAYEPVWAIGTGVTATPVQAQKAHAFIRTFIAHTSDREVAEDVPILYGGSVKAENIGELISEKDIDGGLVGGASLDPNGFAAVYQKMIGAN